MCRYTSAPVGVLRRIAHLINIKLISGNVVEFGRLLLLDSIFQVVDRLTARNPNPKGATDIMPENRTIERELLVHEGPVPLAIPNTSLEEQIQPGEWFTDVGPEASALSDFPACGAKMLI